MIKKLRALYYKALTLAAHFEYYTNTVARLSTAGEAVQEVIELYMPELRQRLAEEETVLRWEHVSELTVQIAETNRSIDNLLVAINALVAAGRHSTGSAIKASAEKVFHKIKSYGRITEENYEAKAGDVRALIKDLTTDLAHDADNLGIGLQVQLLGVALNKFTSLIEQRLNEQVEKPPYTAGEARLRTQTAWLPIETVINANAVTNEAADEFGAFIDIQNLEIARYNEAFHRATKDISVSGRTLIAAIPTQIYTGQPITPIPEIWFIDEDGKATRMWLGKDFDVSFHNNTNVGPAEVIIHGKGNYTGQTIGKFNIARAK
jgi:hypothetical protein